MTALSYIGPKLAPVRRMYWEGALGAARSQEGGGLATAPTARCKQQPGEGQGRGGATAPAVPWVSVSADPSPTRVVSSDTTSSSSSSSERPAGARAAGVQQERVNVVPLHTGAEKVI